MANQTAEATKIPHYFDEVDTLIGTSESDTFVTPE